MRSHSCDSGHSLRIGLFTHSTNPRGGVVHVLELAEALSELGHHVVVHAPDVSGRGFFRDVRVEQALIPAAPVAGDLCDLVRQRVGEYTRYLSRHGAEFDIYHAHDGISGSALADLVFRGIVPGFVRTVHHLDEFADPFLRAAQDCSVVAASRCICVSNLWRDHLRERYDIEAPVIPNGVNVTRFNPGRGELNGSDAELNRFPRDTGFQPVPETPKKERSRLTAHPVHSASLARVENACHHETQTQSTALHVALQSERPLFLAVGGIERRKNAVNLLRAFLIARREMGRGTLLIAGGASLLDHSAYRAEFERTLASAGTAARRSVVVTGPLSDRDLLAAYRIASALVFPSLVEGFGLAVLEAMACGTPVVASNVPPFTEYLTGRDALLVNPEDAGSIAAAMQRACEPEVHSRLREAGLALSRRFTWSATAAAHAQLYHDLLSITGA